MGCYTRKSQSDDHLKEETIYAIGELLTNLVDVMEGCAQYQNLAEICKAQKEGGAQ